MHSPTCTCGCNSGAYGHDFDRDDMPDWQEYYGVAYGQVPHTLIQRFVEPTGSLVDRNYGTYNLIPGRVVSSQTRLKNMVYEYPAYGWTTNPESPPWVPSVPAHGKFITLSTTTNFGTQESFLQPTGALTMQSEQSWLEKIQNFFSPQAVGQTTGAPPTKGSGGSIYMNSYGFDGGNRDSG